MRTADRWNAWKVDLQVLRRVVACGLAMVLALTGPYGLVGGAVAAESADQPEDQAYAATDTYTAADTSAADAANTEAAAANAGSGRIRFIEGSPRLERADKEMTEDATVNAALFDGDVAITPTGGRLEIQLANGALIRLDQNSRLSLLAMPSPSGSANDIVLQLPSGSAQVELRRGPSKDVDYRVDTPTASVYLLASGQYRFDVEGKYGKLRVSSYRGVAEVVGDEGSVMLRSGQRTTVGDSGEPDSPSAFNTAAADAFDGWVEDRTEVYRAAVKSDPEDDVDPEALPEQVRPYSSELNYHGRWVNIEPYGLVWVPDNTDSNWRPYYNGYWSYSGDYGYIWNSYDPWGWAPYHYGRWVYGPGYGWGWAPGCVWGGAWVSWYYGSFYVGWAPLNYWNYPCYWGYGYGYYPYHYGYPWIDYRCWAFVPYTNLYVNHVPKAIVPGGVVKADIAKKAGVLTRKGVPITPGDVAGKKVSPPDVIKRAGSMPASSVIKPSRDGATKQSFRDGEQAIMKQTPAQARKAGSTPTTASSGTGSPKGATRMAPGSPGAGSSGAGSTGATKARPSTPSSQSGASTGRSGSSAKPKMEVPSRPRVKSQTGVGARSAGAPDTGVSGSKSSPQSQGGTLSARPRLESRGSAAPQSSSSGANRMSKQSGSDIAPRARSQGTVPGSDQLRSRPRSPSSREFSPSREYSPSQQLSPRTRTADPNGYRRQAMPDQHLREFFRGSGGRDARGAARPDGYRTVPRAQSAPAPRGSGPSVGRPSGGGSRPSGGSASAPRGGGSRPSGGGGARSGGGGGKGGGGGGRGGGGGGKK